MNNAKVSEKKYRRQCCYILQEDNLYPTFTVQETMMLSASLKISGISSEEKKQIVSVILFSFVMKTLRKTKQRYALRYIELYLEYTVSD